MITIEITGQGLESALTTSIVRPASSVSLDDVPAGHKVALIRCYDDSSNLLVQRKDSFVIADGQTTDSGEIPLGIALTVRAHKFTKSAVRKIEAAGGKVELLGK